MAVDDDFFGPAYVDVDEWREGPIRFRYVHGGFEGTDTRFSFYFPTPDHYEGRFLQFLQGGLGGTENNAELQPLWSLVALAADRGAYLVESNQGHVGGRIGREVDQSIICWRASAEAARFSKQMAADMYGEEPHHGYVFGGSGGGVRSLACLEHVEDLWDGAVPFIIPDTSVLFGFLPMLVNAVRVLQPVLPEVADAIEVGGSGDPFANLTGEQADALATLYKAGFPRHAILDPPREAFVAWEVFKRFQYDPTYLDDFWNKPGYLGADHPDSLRDDLLDIETTVLSVLTPAELREQRNSLRRIDPSGKGAALLAMLTTLPLTARMPVGLTVADGDPEAMGWATVRVLTGRAAGREFDVTAVIGDALVALTADLESALAATGQLSNPVEEIEPGDRIRISNHHYLAYSHRFRHQVELASREWSHLTVDGKPMYPQRDKDEVHELVFLVPFTHEIRGKKVIMLQNMVDQGAWPSIAVRYQERLRLRLGADLDDHFRLYFVEHAEHASASALTAIDPKAHAKRIDFEGYIQQAVRDLIEWVEFGKEPLPSSGHTYTSSNAVMLAQGAANRRGLQPVVEARANGAACIEARVGESVRLEANIEVPPGAGRIIRIEWDPEGGGSYPIKDDGVDGTQTEIRTGITHRYAEPGTYFPVVRTTAHRDGNVNAELYRLRNLGRVRVVVV